MTRRILTGVGSLLLMAAILVGLPAALTAIHNVGAIHVELTPAGIWAALMRPDDGTLALFLIKVAGWIVWAICLSLVAVEVISRVRHVKVPHLSGLAVPQALTRSIVTSAVTLFISAGSVAAPQHNPPSPADVSTTSGHSPTDLRLLAAPKTEPGARSYTVKKGDTLSEIALDKLGNGHRYPAIFKASTGIGQPGGVHLTDPDMIDIGWTLNIPPRHKPKTPDEPRTDNRRPTSTRPPKVDQPTPPTGQATPPPATASPIGVSANPSSSTPTEATEPAADYQPGWLLTGLTGAGAVLAGSLWLLLRRRREIQYRHRRPGRTIHNAPQEIIPVEKTIIREGEPIANTILFIDETLRRLAATLVSAGAELPDVTAAELGADRLHLHLSHPAVPPEPWAADGENTTWTITNTGDPERIGSLAPGSPPPWPQLVTVGEADDGHAWLLNLEHYGTATITGDTDFTADLARYIAGELATNPWSRDVTLHLLNTCGEVSGINTDRTRFYTDPKVVDTLIAEAVETVDRVNATHTTSLATSRFKWTGDELWDSRALIAPTQNDGHLPDLANLIINLPGRTATSLILVGSAGSEPAKLELRTTPDGRVLVPELGLDLVVNGLTAQEALGCAQLIQAADTLEDEPLPAAEHPEQAWQQWSDAAGLIKASVATERDEPDPDAVSVLPATNEEIVAVTASTIEELQRIAPTIPAPVAAQMLASDSLLDTDLAEWFAESSDRPRLAVLGRVKLRVGRGGQPVESARRRPYYTEIVAYLATKPRGATTAEICDAFGLDSGRMRKDLTMTRKWLGVHPITGHRFLPEATESADSQRLGVGLYKVCDVLIDADLFLRLRTRAQAKGADGLSDLMTALSFVEGKPYTGLRDGGGTWLLDSHDDQHLLVAVIDVAHTAASMALAAGDPDMARAAVDVETRIAPYDEMPKFDAAEIARFEGDLQASASISREAANARDEDGPINLSERGSNLLDSKDWQEKSHVR